MNTFKLGKTSWLNLKGVDTDLIAVAVRALEISSVDGTVLAGGGLRSQSQAAANAARGTGILKSRHLTGDAIDLVALTNGRVVWKNQSAFVEMARAVKQAAAELEIPIQQGCDWDIDGNTGERGEWDWPHFQNPLPHRMAAAVSEMKRHRAELGLDTADGCE